LRSIHRAGLSNRLTDRELQVLAYQTTSLSRIGFSRELGIPPGRLQRYITAITRKLTAAESATCCPRYQRSPPGSLQLAVPATGSHLLR
jgi:hypothetical protein